MSYMYEEAMSILIKAGDEGGIDGRVMKLLSLPRRVNEFSIPFKRDDGSFQLYRAFRVHYNDALGPPSDGTRFVSNLDLQEVKALALLMTIKHSVSGIPAGGGKGGIRVDTSQLSDWELERLSRAYLRNLIPRGPASDIPGADIGTGYRTQAWMLDEYEQITGLHSPAAVNDKPYIVGGSLGGEGATGLGIFHVAQEAFQEYSLNRGVSIAVQGFGQVGSYLARYFYDEGYRVTAVSDISGGITSEDGIHIPSLQQHVKEHGLIEGFNGRTLSNEELLETDCDVLILAAVQGVITAENASAVKARMIIEGANAPITVAGEEKLKRQGVVIIPDILANVGGAIVCHYERIQGVSGRYWTKEKVHQELQDQILITYRRAGDTAKDLGSSLRIGAWVTALRRIEEAVKLRGWV